MSVVGIPNNKISDEAVEAAARALCADDGLVWDARSDPGQREYRHNARAALAAAVPYIEAEIRAKIAAEIGALRDEPPQWDVDASWTFERQAILDAAARVARGTREDQK